MNRKQKKRLWTILATPLPVSLNDKNYRSLPKPLADTGIRRTITNFKSSKSTRHFVVFRKNPILQLSLYVSYTAIAGIYTKNRKIFTVVKPDAPRRSLRTPTTIFSLPSPFRPITTPNPGSRPPIIRMTSLQE